MVRLILALTIFALLLLAGCSGGSDSTATPEQPLPTGTTPATLPTATEPAAGTTATPVEDPDTTATAGTPDPEPTATMPAPEQLPLAIGLVEFATGLDTPVGIVAVPDGSSRLFIVEKPGTIAILVDGAVAETKLLDISDRVHDGAPEQGLLGLALHPSFVENGFFYVNYTDNNGDTVIARYETNRTLDQADPSSEMVILHLEQPANNHNGGNLEFGPDGYLYIGTGDGGGSGDTFDQAQNGQTLLGAMLRIDVDGGEPYAIPPDNPFINDPDVLDEIWAIGLRNPWRYSFDSETGALFIADVGQNRIEEINLQPAGSTGGENYGWPMMEGTSCFESNSCDATGLVLPIFEYDHSFGCSVTGGEVYRGTASPELTGLYFLSDFCSGNIWGLSPDGNSWQSELLLESGLNISAFGTSADGELLLADMYAGTLYRLIVLQ